MTQVNRETLKQYFHSGNKPTSSQFHDLVDSIPNIIDDGINHSNKGGLKLSPLNGKGPVLEFFRNIQDSQPIWTFSLDSETKTLSIGKTENDPPLIILYPNQSIHIQGNLEVNGQVFARSFCGNYMQKENSYRTIKADGTWQTIPLQATTKTDGCRAYRIMAGCGKSSQNKYALLEATVMHCYGHHRRIKIVGSWIGNCFNRIQLRWYKTGGNSMLQIRSRRNYGDEVFIRYQVIELWNDYYMTHPINSSTYDEPTQG